MGRERLENLGRVGRMGGGVCLVCGATVHTSRLLLTISTHLFSPAFLVPSFDSSASYPPPPVTLLVLTAKRSTHVVAPSSPTSIANRKWPRWTSPANTVVLQNTAPAPRLRLGLVPHAPEPARSQTLFLTRMYLRSLAHLSLLSGFPLPPTHLLASLAVVVVGRSNIVGRPMAALCLRRSATVTVAHSRTTDLPAVCRTADVLVVAVGQVRVCTPSLQHTALLHPIILVYSPRHTTEVWSPTHKQKSLIASPNMHVFALTRVHSLSYTRSAPLAFRSPSPIRPVLTPARSSSRSRAWCRRTGSNRARW